MQLFLSPDRKFLLRDVVDLSTDIGKLDESTARTLSIVSKRDDLPEFGNRKSRVRLDIITDYQCPFCAALNEQLREVRDEFRDEILITEFPVAVPIHKQSKAVAKVALCTYKLYPERFWEINDLMMQQQNKIAFQPPGANFVDLLRLSNFDPKPLENCFASEEGGTEAVMNPAYPFALPFVAGLDLRIAAPVAFFVGENGTGKSTLLEAIAALCRLPVLGGGRGELADYHGPEQDSPLSHVLRPSFRRQPWDEYFLRAEFQAHFASLLEARKADPDFWGDPYELYGRRSLHARSHREAF